MAPTAENAGRVREIGPEAVTRAVTLRLSRLPTEARRLAVAVAVLGDGAELQHAAELAELDDKHLASLAASSLARTDLLHVSTLNVEFVHPVVRTAVYESIEPTQRLTAHRRAAQLLDESDAEPERVAAHRAEVETVQRSLRSSEHERDRLLRSATELPDGARPHLLERNDRPVTERPRACGHVEDAAAPVKGAPEAPHPACLTAVTLGPLLYLLLCGSREVIETHNPDCRESHEGAPGHLGQKSRKTLQQHRDRQSSP